jgi:hypothetical protein
MLNPLPDLLARFAGICLVISPLAFASGCFDPMVREVFLDPEGSVYVPTGNRPSERGALGDLCIQGDEDFPEFSGYTLGEVNLSTRDLQCRSEACLVDHFQGRVTCPEGNQDGAVCLTPLGEVVTTSVLPQLPERPAEDAVYCTCRCDGPRGAGPFCDCPDDMLCEERFSGGPELLDVAGSYCVKRL